MGSDLALGERGDCSMIISNLVSNANACPQDASQVTCGGRLASSNTCATVTQDTQVLIAVCGHVQRAFLARSSVS